jgi:hypothetical protein
MRGLVHAMTRPYRSSEPDTCPPDTRPRLLALATYHQRALGEHQMLADLPRAADVEEAADRRWEESAALQRAEQGVGASQANESPAVPAPIAAAESKEDVDEDGLRPPPPNYPAATLAPRLPLALLTSPSVLPAAAGLGMDAALGAAARLFRALCPAEPGLVRAMEVRVEADRVAAIKAAALRQSSGGGGGGGGDDDDADDAMAQLAAVAEAAAAAAASAAASSPATSSTVAEAAPDASAAPVAAAAAPDPAAPSATHDDAFAASAHNA